MRTGGVVSILWFDPAIDAAQEADRREFPWGFDDSAHELQALYSALTVWRTRCGTRRNCQGTLWLTQRRRHRNILVRAALDYGMPATAAAIGRQFDGEEENDAR